MSCRHTIFNQIPRDPQGLLLDDLKSREGPGDEFSRPSREGQRSNFNMASSSSRVSYGISLQEAKRKCSERNSCFIRVESTEHIGLHSRYLGRLKEGVKEELNSKLMKYSDVLEGVPVNYESIQIQQRTGSILDELPYIHFDVKVNFIVFKPTVGSTLVGVVNKFGVDHVGCLVHNCFNASVSKSNFRNGFMYDNLDIGSEFAFKVIGTEAVNGVLAITGQVGQQKETR